MTSEAKERESARTEPTTKMNAGSESDGRVLPTALVSRSLNLPQSLDSALFLAVTTGLMLYWGYTYYRGFYSRLSYGEPVPLDDSPRYLLKTATIIFGALFILTNLSSSIAPRPKKIVTRSDAIGANLVPFAFVCYLIIWTGTAFFDWFLIGFLCFMAVTVVVLTFLKRDVMSSAGDYHRWHRIIVFGGVGLALGNFIFSTNGRVDATRLIEGNWDEGSTVTFDMVNPDSIFDRKTYAFIENRDDSYYFVEMSDPAPKRPKLMVIPASDVESATIQRMNEDGPR